MLSSCPVQGAVAALAENEELSWHVAQATCELRTSSTGSSIRATAQGSMLVLGGYLCRRR